MNNPFTERHLIKDPTKFFGRKEEIHHIVNRLRHLQSIAVVGERRIGKSSLLYYLSQIGREKLGTNSRLVYVDLQDVRNHTDVGQLFTNILKELEIPFVPQESIPKNLIAFSDAVEAFKNIGVNLVLLLNEFEELIQHREAFPEDFFDQLRVLIEKSVFGIVTSSQIPLRDLCLGGKLASPFYNVFNRIDLQEFAEDEAEEFLIADWGIDPFAEDEVSFILSYPQYRHPLILQIVCYWVFENRTMQLSEKGLEDEIKHDAENYFAKGFFNQARRRKGDIIRGGKELWEMAKAIILKRLGG